jgi:hypothetical protein
MLKVMCSVASCVHRVVEEAWGPAPISARLLDARVPGEIDLARSQSCYFRSAPPVVLKWVLIARRFGTRRSIE